MISENAPDILYLKRGFGTVDDYIRQGLLEDLNTWIDTDPEIDRADYLNNIFEAKRAEICPMMTSTQLKSFW